MLAGRTGARTGVTFRSMRFLAILFVVGCGGATTADAGVDAAEDAAIPMCPAACDPSVFETHCCVGSAGPELHECSDAGVVTAAGTCQ